MNLKGEIENADSDNADASDSVEICFELIDLCNDARHTTITPPITFDQVYMLTDDSKPDYVFPEFDVFPAYCQLNYDCRITQRLSNGETAITLTGRRSSFFYDRTTDVLGDTQTVTCTASSTSDFGQDAVEADESYDLTFTNPCCDDAFVKIVKPSLPEKTYILNSDPISWTHADYTVEYNPQDHSLCGTLEVAAFYDGNPIVPGMDLKYELTGDNTFQLESEN